MTPVFTGSRPVSTGGMYWPLVLEKCLQKFAAVMFTVNFLKPTVR